MVQVHHNMPKNKNAQKAPQNDNKAAAQKALQQQIETLPDPVELSKALINAYQQSQPLFIDMLQKMGQTPPTAELPSFDPDPMNAGGAAINFMNGMNANPLKFWDMQMTYAQKQAQLWQSSMNKMWGQESEPVIEPQKGDRRFRAESWNDSVFFDFIKQYYLLACDFVEQSIENAESLSEADKKKLTFTSKLMMDALSPSNFAMTNPEVLQETLQTGGMNLVRGLQNMQEDFARGGGNLKISTTDYNAFKLGENIATTPGHVVYENDLMQLIQYEPTTKTVFKHPLMIIPPWINKYYILDLTEKNSMVKWMVDKGYTVFMISWANPDETLVDKDFQDYMLEGPLAALEAIEQITGQRPVNAIGYCMGGTLLACTTAYLQAKDEGDRIASNTYMASLQDFSDPGDMGVFIDEEQISAFEKQMDEQGYLDGCAMSNSFSMLRANDLVWSYVVKNYLKGTSPVAFDVLFWNSDSTNLPAKMHSFYLRNMYLHNRLREPGGITLNNVPIDLSKITNPVYFIPLYPVQPPGFFMKFGIIEPVFCRFR